MHVRAKMREEETLLNIILRYHQSNSSFIKGNFSQLTWHFSLQVWHLLTRGRSGPGEVEEVPSTEEKETSRVNSRHIQCWRRKMNVRGWKGMCKKAAVSFPNGSFSSVSILEGWLLICSICSGTLLWPQTKPSALCSQWLIQAALKVFTCDTAVVLLSLGRAGDRRRDRVAAGQCFPALHHWDPCRAAGSPGGEGTAASWDPLAHMVLGGFVVSSQMCASVTAAPAAGGPEPQQGHGRQGPSQSLTALSLCPLVP